MYKKVRLYIIHIANLIDTPLIFDNFSKRDRRITLIYNNNIVNNSICYT